MKLANKPLAYLAFTATFISYSLPALASETVPTDLGSPNLTNGIAGSVFAAPAASPAAGTYTAAQNVVLTAPGASFIRYTVNGSDPACQSGSLYSAPIAVEASLTIKAISCAGDMSSQIKSFAYAINVETPPPSPSGGGGGGGLSDTIPPTDTSIMINSGSASTDTTAVNLSLSAAGASQMMISNSADFAGAAWESYAIAKTWTLTDGAGTKTVYAKFRDAAGNESAAVSDSINILAPLAQEQKDESEENPVVAGVETDWRTVQLGMILAEAAYVRGGECGLIAANAGKARNAGEEKKTREKYTNMLMAGINGLSEKEIDALTCFIHYGSETTKPLGAGERAGVINSYKSAFGKLPKTENEWADAVKIANGRWPGESSQTAENKAKAQFRKVYLRDPNMANANDNAAVTVMAYGLRPSDRNLASEAAAIKIFKSIFGYNPSTAVDWDTVRAIAYSGAKR